MSTSVPIVWLIDWGEEMYLGGLQGWEVEDHLLAEV